MSSDVFHNASGNLSVLTLSSLQDSDMEPGPHTVLSISRNRHPTLVLYSARYDSTRQVVVLVGYFDRRIGPVLTVFCRLKFRSPQEASKQLMDSDYGRTYGGVLYFCPVENWKPAPQSLVRVKVEYSDSIFGTVVLPVQYAKSEETRSSVAACVTALRHIPSMESEARFILRLVEFIEVNRILGVEHFYFYNWSLPLGVSRTLRHYAGLGWATIHQWSLPSGIHPENDIHYFGQVPIINDCLYAARDQYRLIAFIDIDEFLVPLGGTRMRTLAEVSRQHALTSDGGGPCALAFRYGLFPMMSDAQLANITNSNRLPSGLRGCHVTNIVYDQRGRIIPKYPYTKILAVARQIKVMAIHHVMYTWSECSTKVLCPVREGLVHHRRSVNRLVEKMVKDTTMRRYERSIGAAMAEARHRLNPLLGFDICR